ncbi:hypothetical protein LGH70_04615 [Hymenobacter sp. BT635]|uniref:Uncharacterized protein n=1 Tax=Hymenobacter nitidus TaxID=2880929 RepID=A0ABS8AC87_9BACT|nr:hypothetical protein [Hymenobacter nitidus]MCB2376850.1 hypothetical protein [Hymenobacter nitidus]
MATSFVNYQGHGFWCLDAHLEVWLGYAVEVLARRGPALPPWLLQLREEWYLQASVGFTGCIELGLDETLTDAGRLAAVQQVAAATNQLLAAHGSHIPAPVLNSRPTNPEGSRWHRAVATADFLTVGYLLQALLAGQLTTTASSPLDYLAPEQWRRLGQR